MRGHTLDFNTEATRWLGVYLDTELQFRSYKGLLLEKARKAEDRVRQIGSTNGPELSIIRRI